MIPHRVQLRRTKGWQNAARHEKGRSFVLDGAIHSWSRTTGANRQSGRFECETVPTLDLTPLRGKNLACWCRLDVACHADVLLRYANAGQETTE